MDLNDYAKKVHKANDTWWRDINKPCVFCTGGEVVYSGYHGAFGTKCIECAGSGLRRLERNMGEMLMLCVSELAEAMEGHRKNLQDDKLPHRSMLEVELVDCLIRIFDIAGSQSMDIEGAFQEKMRYNALREDHKVEARRKDGGKKY